MTRSDVSNLSIPPPTAAQLAFREEMREAREQRKAEHATRQSVSVVGSPTGSTVRVVLQGAYIDARLTPSARDVHPGDRAIVQKKGGVWTVVEVETWREPPTVGPKPTPASIPAASTTSSNVGSWNGNVPSSLSVVPSLPSNLSALETWLNSLRTNFNTGSSAIANLRGLAQVRGIAIEALQDALNSNATRTNQTRDAATSAVNAVGGVHDAVTTARIGKAT